MKSIIFERLCRNNVVPEKSHLTKTMRKNIDECDKLYKKAQESLGEQFGIVQQLLDASETCMSDEAHQFFAEGIKLGILIGIEAAGAFDKE